MRFSIIVGYKNRHISRVKNALNSVSKQSIIDFELIFIDYGSDDSISAEIKFLIQKYPFIKYYYYDAKGWFWNRAHAINIGIKKAIGEIILIYDIDLIIEEHFLEKINFLIYENIFYTFNCYYLSEEFVTTEENLKKYNLYENYVGLCAIKKSYLSNICGFDQYYMIWGLEDDDLYYRLIQNGIKKIELVSSDYKVYHQWHPVSYDAVPSAWYYEMTSYYYSHEKFSINENFLSSNPERCLSIIYFENQYERFPQIRLKDKLITAFQNFWNEFEIMSSGEIRWFKFLKPPHVNTEMSYLISVINKILNSQNLLKYKIAKRIESGIQTTVTAEDVVNFIQFFVGTNREILSDYYYEETNDFIFFIYKRK